MKDTCTGEQVNLESSADHCHYMDKKDRESRPTARKIEKWALEAEMKEKTLVVRNGFPGCSS